MTAAAPQQLIRGGGYGSSVWRKYFFMRYAMHLALGNVSRWFAACGMPISKGTLVSHDGYFLELFKPLHELIGKHQMQADCIQMDELAGTGDCCRRHKVVVLGVRDENSGALCD